MRLAPDNDAHGLGRLDGEWIGLDRGLGGIAVCALADDFDKVIDLGSREEQSFKNLGAGLRLAQKKAGAAQHHFAAVLDVACDGVLDVQQTRLAVVNGQHVHAERGLQRGVLV